MNSIICALDGNSALPEERSRLPLDPYLAYWTVEPKNRQLKTWRTSSQRVNPCVDDEFADIPSPEYFWYFYNPFANHCSQSQIPDTHLSAPLRVTRHQDLPSKISLDVAALETRAELHMSVIYGYVVHDHKSTELTRVKTAIENQSNALLPEFESWDPTSRQFLWLWNKLPAIARVDSTTIEIKDGYLIASAKGQLKPSLKPFVFRTYLGPTDVYGPTDPKHWSETLRAMLADDIVIYGGHSGLGENLRIARVINGPIDFKTAIKPIYQIFAYISCYSYTYFDQGQIPVLGPRSQRNLDLFMVGGTMFKSEQIVWDLLRLINDSLSLKSQIDLNAYFPSDSLIIHSRLKSN